MFFLESPNEELGRLQGQQIIVALGVEKTSEWCNSFMLVLKVNDKVRLCADLARLNEVLIRNNNFFVAGGLTL